MIMRTTMTVPARATLVPVIREHVVSALTHLGVAPDDIYRAEVVITETCSNVVRHAFDSPQNHFEVEIEIDPDRLAITVSDTGRGFDSRSVPLPQPGQIGGYGVHFIRSNADAVHFHNIEPNGTRMRAEIMLHYEDEAAREAAEEMNVPQKMSAGRT